MKKNILHVNKLLSNPYGQANLKLLRDIRLGAGLALKKAANHFLWTQKLDSSLIMETDDNAYAVEIEDSTQFLDSEAQFMTTLESISQQRNHFNDMPMREVISFFNILCCEECSNEIPQLSRSDYIHFLENAFLGKNNAKAEFVHRKLMITYQVFHQFYLTCYNKLYVNLSGSIDAYIGLLTTNFVGFDFEKVKNNFKTNDDHFLVEVRAKYKTALQQLQPSQEILSNQ